MARIREAVRNPAFRKVLLVALLPLVAGPVFGAWIQDATVGGWEYGAAGGLIAGGALSAFVGVPLYLLIRVIGRH